MSSTIKSILLFVTSIFVCSSILAQEPILQKKDLSVNKAYRSISLTAIDGFVQVNETKNLQLDTAKGYSIEFKARVKSNTGRGLDVEARDGFRNGFRISASFDALKNNFAPTTPENLVSVDNNTDYAVFRYAVKGNKAHIWRNGVFVSTINTGYLTKEELLLSNNPGFESDDMTPWTLKASQVGRTTNAAEVRSGNAALKLSAYDGSEVASFVIKGIKPNTNYGLSFWSKGITMAGNMRFQLLLGYYNSSSVFVQTNVAENTEIKPTTTAWKMIGKPFTTTEGDQVAIVKILGWNSSNTLLIDDFSLTENESTPAVGNTIGTNVITNGTFDANADGWPTTLGWPLSKAQWSATNGGQLQVYETTWAGSWGTTFSINAAVSPGKTYKLSAKTSQLNAGTYYHRIVDVAAKSEVACTATANLAAYVTNATPAFTVGNSTTQVQLQFTTKVQHNGTAKVVMTLDDVVFQEYEANFPSFISFGKMLGDGNADIDIAYFNYNLNGAYAPGIVDPNKALWDSIEVAQDRLASVIIGNIPGKYPQAAYDTYLSAINKAKTDAQTELNQLQLNQAIADLYQAGSVFINSVVKGEYYPISVEFTAYVSKIRAGEATSTTLLVAMNNNQPVDYKFVTVNYSSLTPTIIDVNNIGSVIGKAKGLGRVVVNVAFQDSVKRDTVEVQVVEFASMEFSITNLSLLVNDSTNYSFAQTLSDETIFTSANKLVFSSNRNVIRVDNAGKLHAVGVGTALVTGYVRSANIEKKVVLNVTVSDVNNATMNIKSGNGLFYPNPASNYIRLQFPETINSIEISDLSGRVLEKKTASSELKSGGISLSNLTNGVYLLKIEVGNAVEVSKLIVKK